MAHRKAGGSTSLGRDSHAKRLGVKLSSGQLAKPGSIIITQRGTKYHPGINVKRGNNDSLFALTEGYVEFKHKKVKKFNGNLASTCYVSIIPKNK